MYTLILQGGALTQSVAMQIADQADGVLDWQLNFAHIVLEKLPTPAALTAWRDAAKFDVNLYPRTFEPKETRLLVMDMDSTLINIECVDEIADFLQLKPEVSAITESAMRGEIDFETSLRKRVALLKGLDVSALEKVYEQRLQLNSGAETMLAGLKNQGVKTALVSGGFTFFTERLQQRLGLDYCQANVLGEEKGKLTGDIVGDICGAQAKADFLLARCTELDIAPSQTIAMGDGANDLLMMREAGLSIAYHAKPTVQAEAMTALNYCGLEGVLGLLNISQ